MIRRIIVVGVLLLAGAFALPDNLNASSDARCVGADPCRACSNCSHCARCAKQGLTCGVCKPRKKPL